jgi:hypothetical protein
VVAAHPGIAVGSYPRFDERDYRVMVTLEAKDQELVDAAARDLGARLGERVVRSELMSRGQLPFSSSSSLAIPRESSSRRCPRRRRGEALTARWRGPDEAACPPGHSVRRHGPFPPPPTAVDEAGVMDGPMYIAVRLHDGQGGVAGQLCAGRRCGEWTAWNAAARPSACGASPTTGR